MPRMRRVHASLRSMAWGASMMDNTPFRRLPELLEVPRDLGKKSIDLVCTLRHLHNEKLRENQSLASERELNQGNAERFQTL